MIVWRRLAAIVAEHGAAALVSLKEARGSTPREAGARMVVRPDGAFHGTIGGGQLEWQMLGEAREALAAGRGPARRVGQALGPDLGQCCGGHVTVLIETFDRRDKEELTAFAEREGAGPFAVTCSIEQGRVRRRPEPASDAGSVEWREAYGDAPTPVVLFGAGHVGRALVLALAPLPFAVRWIDSRADAFPSHVPGNVVTVRTPDPVAEAERTPDDAFVLVMTHEHPLDLAVTAAALRRPHPYLGLIGSVTKRARFEKRFREIGITDARIRSLVCPIGLPGIRGKEPAVIAASVVAQLLEVREKMREFSSGPDALPMSGRSDA